MEEIIQVSHLSKTYLSQKGAAPVKAVDSIDFTVRQGEVFGFLGPNGAGKTTTIRMLTGLTRPTVGMVSIFGADLHRNLARIKKQIGVVPDVSNLYDELTAYQNLVFDMQLYGVPRKEWQHRAEELLNRFDLVGKRDTPFSKLSRGMKRALTIAAALAHNPSLVFLDEPTTGLDVMNARKLRRMIAALRERGVTVFLTTHYLEEAERLCDRIALIVKGKIVALDSIAGLKKLAQTTPSSRLEITWRNSQGEIITRLIDAENVQTAAYQALASVEDGEVLSINTRQPTLEDVFVRLTGLDSEVMLTEKGNGKGQGNVGG